MSTKIYNAYRLKRGIDLWAFLREIRKTAEKNAKEVLRKHIAEVYEGYKKDFKGSNEYFLNYVEVPERFLLTDPEALTPFQAGWIIRRAFEVQNTRATFNVYGMNVSVSIREYNKRFYIIAHANGLMGSILKFLEEHPALEDYHYQNQADRPEEISAREWARRKKVWNAMDEGSRVWRDAVHIDIVHPDLFFYIDPTWDEVKKP